MENKYKTSNKKNKLNDKNLTKQTRTRVLSLAQLLSRVRKQRGFSGVTQGSTNVGINVVTSSIIGNAQFRNLQIGSNQKGITTYSKGKYYNVSKQTSGLFYNQDPSLNMQKFSLGMTKNQSRMENQKDESRNQKNIKPIIPPKSLVIILKEKPEKVLYNRRIIDYKHCGLLQRYIGLGGKILPRRQTRLTAKQQRYIAKTIKSARIMGLLPFVSKEKGYFR
jgi:small subunit ribosomal protein S18